MSIEHGSQGLEVGRAMSGAMDNENRWSLVDSVYLAAVFIDAKTITGKRVEEDGRRRKEYALTICCVV
jgi:hypothetical protein